MDGLSPPSETAAPRGAPSTSANSGPSSGPHPATPRRSAAVAAVRCPRRSASQRRPNQHDRPPVRSRRDPPSPSRKHEPSSCPTCPSVPRPRPAIAPQAHLTRVSALSGQDSNVPIRPVIRVTAGGGASMWSPVSRRLSATGIRFSGHPAPAGASSTLTSGYQPKQLLRLDPIGVFTFRMRQTRPGWAPSEPRDGGALPPGQVPPSGTRRLATARSLSPAGASHRAEVPMTRRHRGFTCLHPSGLPQPVTPGWNRDPWAFPRASHPAVTRDARRGGDGPCALEGTLHPRHQTAPPSMRVAALMRLACRTTWLSQEE
jgi:hypothetical protein